MTILYRYFFALVTRCVVATVLAIAALFFVLHLLDNLGRSSIHGALGDLRDSLLAMPEVLVAALPACCGIGAAVGLAVMDGRTEFAMMRIMGASRRRLLAWTASTGAVWVVVFLALTETVLPSTAAISREIEIRQAGSLLTSGEEVWLKTSDGFAMIASISPDGTKVQGLWTFSGDNDSIDSVRNAKEAVYSDGIWSLTEVEQASYMAGGQWQFSEAGNGIWVHGPDPDLLTAFTIQPDKLPLGRLIDLSQSLRELRQNTVAIDMIIWGRVFDALSIVALMLAGHILVKTRTKESAVSIRAAAVVSLMVMIFYYYSQVIIRQHALDANWPGVVGAAVPPLILATLVLLALLGRKGA